MAFALTGAYHFSTGNDLSLTGPTLMQPEIMVRWAFLKQLALTKQILYSGNTSILTKSKVRALWWLTIRKHAYVLSEQLDFGWQRAFSALPAPSIQLRQQGFVDYNGCRPRAWRQLCLCHRRIRILALPPIRQPLSFTEQDVPLLMYQPTAAFQITCIAQENDGSRVGRKAWTQLIKTHFAQGQLMINGGYQALNYFNAVTRANSTRLGPRICCQWFGIFGPYLGVRWLSAA